MNVPYAFSDQNVIDWKCCGVASGKRKGHAKPEHPVSKTCFHYARRNYLNQYFRRFHYHDTQGLSDKDLVDSTGEIKSGSQQRPQAEGKTEDEAQQNSEN